MEEGTIDSKVENDKVQTLKEELFRFLLVGHQAQNDVYTNSREAEDSIRDFQAEQKERLDELAEQSVLDLRDVTDRRSAAVTKVLEDLTGHINQLSGRTHTEQDVLKAERYVESCKEGAAFPNCDLRFEGSLDLAESLLSVSRLGCCNATSDDTRMCNVVDETQKKVYHAPFWCQTGCRLAGEHSWTTTSVPSVSDNGFYETPRESPLYVDNLDTACKFPEREEKIFNILYERSVVRYVSEFEAYKHRTPCVIPDVALLADMKLVLLDHYHNSIQLFDNDFSQLDEKSFPYPIGVSTLNENTVVVTLRRTGQLAIFSINEKKLHHQRNIRIRCESYLWQVTYKSQRLFVVCDENNIHVLDTAGSEYYVIRSGVVPERGYLRYFDVNDKDCHIYLSERRGLRCIDFKGKLLWLFTNDNFPEKERDKEGHIIEDVCYHEGTILGTHWTLSKIYQISTNGQFLRNLILDHLEHPRVMTVLGKRLVVTQFHPLMKSAKRRTLKVFELENLGV